MAEVRAKLVSGTPVEAWIHDEIGLVRRTNSPIAWPERAHVRPPATINAPSRPICSARYARKTRSRCRPRAACSFISTRSPPRSPPGGHAILTSIKAADRAQKDLRVPSSISLPPLPPRHAPSSTTRKTSAVHALEGEVTLPRVVVGTRFFRGCQSNVRGAPRSSGPTRFTSHQSGSRCNERRTCETDMGAIMRLYWWSIERTNIVGAIRRFGLLPDLP